MKTFFAFLLLSASFVLDIDKTATINRLKKNAEIAFKSGYFHSAAQKYDSLIKVFEVKEPQVYLNLAHCYYQLKDTTQSRRYYRYVTDSVPDRNMRSVAFQQLGNLETQTRSIPTYQKAVNYFKNALKMQPENQEARHNYEVARKILNELQQQRQQQQNNQKDQNKDQKEQNEQQKQEEKKDQKKDQDKNKNQQKAGEQQDQKDQKKDDRENPDKNKSNKKDNKDGKKQDEKEGDDKNAEKKDQEGDMKNAKPTEEKGKGEEKEIEAQALRSQRLKNMNLTPEAAQMLLDAMKNSETQYLQQNSRKQKRSTKTNTKDW